jgi:hypothetical protein
MSKKQSDVFTYYGENIKSTTGYYCSDDKLSSSVEFIHLMGSVAADPKDSNPELNLVIRFKSGESKFFLVEKDKEGMWKEESIQSTFKEADEYLNEIKNQLK